jgi:hypothetical protein
MGTEDLLDQAVTMLWSWSGRQTTYACLPCQVYDRANIAVNPPVNWIEMMQMGMDHAGDRQISGFEAFCQIHIGDRDARWFRGEKAVGVYRWRLREER